MSDERWVYASMRSYGKCEAQLRNIIRRLTEKGIDKVTWVIEASESLKKEQEINKVLTEALNNITSEYAEDVYDVDYNPHQNPAFRIANEALAKAEELRG